MKRRYRLEYTSMLEVEADTPEEAKEWANGFLSKLAKAGGLLWKVSQKPSWRDEPTVDLHHDYRDEVIEDEYDIMEGDGYPEGM